MKLWRKTGIPKGVWALGFVSLLMDTSSEMIHCLLPVYLVSVLGVGPQAVGIIEGIAEGTSSIVKIFSGAISDWVGQRKRLVLLGYGLAAATKPVFALASSIDWIVGARFLDRVGKGIRGAPRDALVADLAPPELIGACYGLRQSLDTIGAIAGPLIALVMMIVVSGDYRLVFAVAVIPAVLSVLVITFGVHEPETRKKKQKRRSLHKYRIPWRDLASFPVAFWGVTVLAFIMTLARFSEAFLLLRAQSVGLDDSYVPVVLVAMNVFYTLSAYPVGRLSDRLGREGLLIAGFGVLVLSDAVLAFATGIMGVMVGALLWGLHMGMTQGLLASWVADTAPLKVRGTAFGIFHLCSGVALLAASIIAGGLWAALGPQATFLAGGAFAAVAFTGTAIFAISRSRSTRMPR